MCLQIFLFGEPRKDYIKAISYKYGRGEIAGLSIESQEGIEDTIVSKYDTQFFCAILLNPIHVERYVLSF